MAIEDAIKRPRELSRVQSPAQILIGGKPFSEQVATTSVGESILIPAETIIISIPAEKIDVGQRNYEGRKISEALLERPVRWFHKKFPKVTEDHVSYAGAAITMGGIQLMESQHRAQKYNPKKTILALGLVGVGMLCDLLDGKLARLRRSEMTDEEAKLEEEKKGQFKDPAIDGGIETFQYLESAYTAKVLGRKIAVKAALFNVAVANLPRTFKAVAGMFGISVPEGYKPWDPRFWGTSLGRKAPNYVSTFAPHPEINGVGVPLGETANILTGIADTKVALERLDDTLWPKNNERMSSKEVEFAKYRAPRLALQSLINVGIAVVANKILK